MSIDPKQPSFSDPPAEGAESLPQKRRFKKGGMESDEGEKSEQTIQLLSALLQDLIAKKELSGVAEHESRPAKYHRLAKTGSGSHEGAAPGGPTENVSVPRVEPSPASTLPVAFRTAPVFEPAAEARRRRRLHILYILGILGMTVGAYIAGSHYGVPHRPTQSSDKPPPTAGTPWTDATLGQLDQALTADQAGDIKGAQRLASAIKKPDTPPPLGLDRYLGSLATRMERNSEAETDLQHAFSAAPPGEAAAVNEGLAFNFSRSRDFEKASDYYKAASRLDPFPALVFYHWGEAQRHLGHFQEAASHFRRALDRVPTGQPETEGLRECANLKLRLALLEEGQESGVQSDAAEQLKTSFPSGYWLLTAAALALQHKNLTDAAVFLGRARDALGTTQFEALLNDYFFRAYADRKELTDFFPPDPAARRAKLTPTMTYSVEP